MRRSERGLFAALTGALAVAATYVFFLIYAQYGFLHLLEARLGTGDAVRPAMAAMGVTGLVASLVTAWALGRVPARLALIAGLILCAVSGLASVIATTAATLVVAAAAIGASTAILTVSLASSLRDFVPQGRVGVVAGVATGAAYFACNVPAFFEGSPFDQASVSAVLSTLAAIAVAIVPPLAASARSRDGRHDRAMFTRAGLGAVALAFLALVWLDSAAFRIIQETASLKGVTWGSASQQLLQGSAHLAGAILAGWMFDRGLFCSILGVTWGLFVLSFLAIGSDASWIAIVGPLYAIGISAYSTGLVAYPSLHDEAEGLVSRRWRAGLLYGVAGWLGSALGVGMAQDLHDIPAWFLAASGCAIVASLLYGGGRGLRRAARAAAAPVALALAALVLHGAIRPAAAADAAARGSEVYASEGCVDCHSQYIRPGTFDELAWGPYHPIDRGERPPFVGNRRQGPDLMNVALRRSRAWNRLHLIDPRAVVPGSRMPSYAHLFAEGDRRGDDLVAYLDTRGVAYAGERLAAVRAWTLPADLTPDAGRGRAIFLGRCVPCHGTEGRGDGPLAKELGTPGLDLTKPELRTVLRGPGTEPEEHQLARVVKFGLAPASMPGHETMSDADVAAVVASVLQLRRAGASRAESAR